MAEEVQTGGIVRFRYDNQNQLKLTDKQKKEIEEAYKKADERKRKEKIRKKLIVILIILVIISLVYLLL